MSSGSERTGAVVSTTVTVKLSLSEPPAFVAVQFTVVVPSANVEPDGGVQTIVASFVAVAVNVTTAPSGDVASAVMFAGTVISGAAPLTTVTLKLFVTDPVRFVAVQSTVVVPTTKVMLD